MIPAARAHPTAPASLTPAPSSRAHPSARQGTESHGKRPASEGSSEQERKRGAKGAKLLAGPEPGTGRPRWLRDGPGRVAPRGAPPPPALRVPEPQEAAEQRPGRGEAGRKRGSASGATRPRRAARRAPTGSRPHPPGPCRDGPRGGGRGGAPSSGRLTEAAPRAAPSPPPSLNACSQGLRSAQAGLGAPKANRVAALMRDGFEMGAAIGGAPGTLSRSANSEAEGIRPHSIRPMAGRRGRARGGGRVPLSGPGKGRPRGGRGRHTRPGPGPSALPAA